eukprot:gene32633-40266_t
MTPLSTVLSSVRIVETACCKSLDARLPSINIITGQVVQSFAAITLDSLPSSSLTVLLAIVNVASNAAVTSALIVATLSGASTKEYTVTYGGSVATGQPFTVLSATAAFPAPVLKSAVFTSNGSYIAISFDSKTDQGNTSTVFTCSQLFNFTCAEISTCKWADGGASVNAFVATSDRCAVPGSTFTAVTTSSAADYVAQISLKVSDASGSRTSSSIVV